MKIFETDTVTDMVTEMMTGDYDEYPDISDVQIIMGIFI